MEQQKQDPGEGNGALDLKLAPDDGGGTATEPITNAEPKLRGSIKQPDETNGSYIVLWARKPKRGERAAYEEVCYLEAHDPGQAKRKVLEEFGRSPKPYAERSERARFLLERAGEGNGILIRAVPAMHWEADVEPTAFERPAPILTIR